MREGLRVLLFLLLLFSFNVATAQPSDVISSVSTEKVYANSLPKLLRSFINLQLLRKSFCFTKLLVPVNFSQVKC